MSVISTYEIDNSAALAKRFAALTTEYFDNPVAAKADFAKVPLENIFRMLEMFRYGSFSDESRHGVLALGNVDLKHQRPVSTSTWHSSIENALDRAYTTVYGNLPKEEAVDQLQASLRWLAIGKQPVDPQALQKAKGFFDVFCTNV